MPLFPHITSHPSFYQLYLTCTSFWNNLFIYISKSRVSFFCLSIIQLFILHPIRITLNSIVHLVKRSGLCFFLSLSHIGTNHFRSMWSFSPDSQWLKACHVNLKEKFGADKLMDAVMRKTGTNQVRVKDNMMIICGVYKNREQSHRPVI